MNNRFKAIAAGIMLTGALSVTNQAHAFSIDTFNDTPQSLFTLSGPVTGAQTIAPDAIGGYRKFDILSANGVVVMTADTNPTSNAFSLSNAAGVSSVVSVLWNNNDLGLGGLDLTDTGTSSALKLAITAIDQGLVTITFDITEFGGGGDTATLTLSNLGVSVQTFLFSSFANFSNVNFASVNAIKMTVNAGIASDLTLDLVETNQNINIPEPSSIALIGIGLVGFSAFRKRKSA